MMWLGGLCLADGLCSFNKATLQEATFDKCKLEGVQFEKADLTRATFSDLTLTVVVVVVGRYEQRRHGLCSFNKATLQEATFDKCKLE